MPIPEGFSEVCDLDELKERSGKRYIVNEREIAVFLLEGRVYALNNICPHQHTALIYDGFIEHGCVVCPAHGWMFDLGTGRTPTGRKGLDRYDAIVSAGKVFIKVETKEPEW